MFKNLILTFIFASASIAFANPQQEEMLNKMDLAKQVRMTVGPQTVTPKFSKMKDAEQKTVQTDIQNTLKLIKVGSAYMSDDSVFVIAFGKDDKGSLKRVVIMTVEGKSASVADDITDVTASEIKSTKGSVVILN